MLAHSNEVIPLILVKKLRREKSYQGSEIWDLVKSRCVRCVMRNQESVNWSYPGDILQFRRRRFLVTDYRYHINQNSHQHIIASNHTAWASCTPDLQIPDYCFLLIPIITSTYFHLINFYQPFMQGMHGHTVIETPINKIRRIQLLGVNGRRFRP